MFRGPDLGSYLERTLDTIVKSAPREVTDNDLYMAVFIFSIVLSFGSIFFKWFKTKRDFIYLVVTIAAIFFSTLFSTFLFPFFKEIDFLLFLNMSVVFILVNLGATGGRYAVAKLVSFHKKNNKENLHRLPISFFIKNEQKIIFVYQLVFFLGGCLMFYGVCLDTTY